MRLTMHAYCTCVTMQVVSNHISQLRPYLGCSKASSIRAALMAATGSILLQVGCCVHSVVWVFGGIFSGRVTWVFKGGGGRSTTVITACCLCWQCLQAPFLHGVLSAVSS